MRNQIQYIADFPQKTTIYCNADSNINTFLGSIPVDRTKNGIPTKGAPFLGRLES